MSPQRTCVLMPMHSSLGDDLTLMAVSLTISFCPLRSRSRSVSIGVSAVGALRIQTCYIDAHPFLHAIPGFEHC